MRGLKVRIADTLQEWSEALKNLKTPNSFRQYVDDLFARIDPSKFMPISGGKFTGTVEMAENAQLAKSPVTLEQLQTSTDSLMPKAGGTFTGPVVMVGNAVQPKQPVTLEQMQAALAGIGPGDTSALMPKAGGTFTGGVTLNGDATQALQPTTLQQVQALVSGITPADLSALMAKAGGKFTGSVEMSANATKPLEPVTLQQLQALLAGLGAAPTTYPYDMVFSTNNILLAGDVVAGFIAPRTITIPSTIPGAVAKAVNSAPTANTAVFNLCVEDVPVITITFAKDSKAGVFALVSAGADVVINAGSVVTVKADANSFDSTINYPIIMLVGKTPVA